MFEIQNYDVLQSLMIIFLSNSADHDEIHHNAAFHLGLHCLPKYPFRGFPFTESLRSYKAFIRHYFKKRMLLIL